jgi:DNA-binding transcriptional ArsR family regulator
MDAAARVSVVAALIAEPARARMLNALMRGEAMTATELALLARVSAQTASSHLGAMREAGLVTMDKQGRSRYYALAGPAVAEALEALQVLAADGAQPGYRAALRAEPLRLARTCYDHLAGMLGVAITEAMVRRGHLKPRGADFILRPAGERFFSQLGVNVAAVRAKHRRFARQCLDWSERRPHLAGSLGAALANRCFELGWLERVAASRVVSVTKRGRAAIGETFALTAPF